MHQTSTSHLTQNVSRFVEAQKQMAQMNRSRVNTPQWPIFRDLADIGRFVRPIAQEFIDGVRYFKCRVFRDDDRGWRYYGMAYVSAKLINNNVVGYRAMQ